ncbi:right-handed parallel beta-helix repeat-containing protein [Zeimonas arvi]|uniref:Right handed beta helix domain-containing protein n=1 Tax=Zeimonas arvi TaxID=2498847 RepID=A0A5C8NXX3_9BURK|nr:right-handed parallel beta-helix repeat-containing protein [Zeimonas arvi]TXL65970.1 hypothetical protein FHP08_07780 [Zeimonas arvi]
MRRAVDSPRSLATVAGRKWLGLLPVLPALALLAGCGSQPIGSSRMSPDDPIAGSVRPAGQAGRPTTKELDPLERVAAAERAAAEGAAAQRAAAEEAARQAAELAEAERARAAATTRSVPESATNGRADSNRRAPAAPSPLAIARPEAGRAAAPGVAPQRMPVTIRVGPAGQVRSIAEAARLAKDGDTVEVQAGEYRGDVAVWTQKKLTIKAVGGRAVLIADGRSAEGKGIWVVRGGQLIVEGFDFVGARVPDNNGAGIRLDRGSLEVRDSRFIENENGILTGNDKVSTLILDRCEFTRNGHPSGQSHGLYVGMIERLEIRGSYLSQARGGHLLKSRARINEIFYNRLTDEEGGQASYELEFPSGGEARVVGNLIEQAPTTQNSTIVSYGAEGYKWETNRLTLVHNTIINRRQEGGNFLRVFRAGAAVFSANNLFVGRGGIAILGDIREGGNAAPPIRDFMAPGSYDFRPRKDAAFIGGAVRTDVPEGWPPVKFDRMYRHPRESVAVPSSKVMTPGAFQP